MHTDISAQATEDLGHNTVGAKRMRHAYKKDIATADDDHAVINMDFSQNVSIPTVSNTPSSWYFLYLVSVSVFGIYYANEAKQINYMYDETVSGKGSSQVIGMLEHVIASSIISKLTIYADNCSGHYLSSFWKRSLTRFSHAIKILAFIHPFFEFMYSILSCSPVCC
ncbi:TPA: hypothetical protein N0F65_008972 [Lagenidium giganteum]|uniref:Uncharacterized protein n=1 Tax=Lagenidium giganteum TaxID=4803 RepID=A0AAV2YLF4_9STRA|nr:TPA: hypothetical protein N0F65_008972 [Lagenidium giganteum]